MPEAEPPLGAGVREWLEDEDGTFEAAERARVRQLKVEGATEVTRTPQLHAPPACVTMGSSNGRRVRICPTCASDVPEEVWAGHVCGMAERGGSVRRLISLWEAIGSGDTNSGEKAPPLPSLGETARHDEEDVARDQGREAMAGNVDGRAGWTQGKECPGCGLALAGAATDTEWRI